jgi:hypothetical protein
MPVKPNNPKGHAPNLRIGTPLSGVRLAPGGVRVRMPDEASRTALLAQLDALPPLARAGFLGDLLALALSVLATDERQG